jgi:hypothetical protein
VLIPKRSNDANRWKRRYRDGRILRNTSLVDGLSS